MSCLRVTPVAPRARSHTLNVLKRMAVVSLLAEEICIADQDGFRLFVQYNRLTLSFVQAKQAAQQEYRQ